MAKKTKDSNLSIEERLEQALIPNWDEPYKLPPNWCWVRVDAISSIYTGNSINERVKEEKYTGRTDGFVYLATKDIDFDSAIDYETNVCIPQSDGLKIAPKGSTLLCIEGGSAGRKIGFITQDVCFVNKLCAFVPHSKINPKYLYYAIQSDAFKKQFDAKKHGLIGGVSVKEVSSIFIPFAPVEIQNKIVELIELVFNKLDEAKEKVQEVIDGFESRKAAILHKAFSGELTKKWRDACNVSIESWQKVDLIDVLIDKPRNGFSPKPVDYVTPYKSMTLSATTSGVFLPEHFKYVDETIPMDSYLWLKPGDILIQRANSLEKVGTSAIYTGKEHDFIYPDLMMKLQVKGDTSAQYISYHLKTETVLRYLRSNATGTAGNMPKINQKTVSSIPINLPTLKEQEEIVRSLDMLINKEKIVKETAETVIEQIDTMKKAILARAFRGELGTNDPSEESALELLKSVLMGNTNQQEPQKSSKKSISIPNHIETALLTKLEKKIVSLFYTTERKVVSVDVIMSVSSKKIDIIDTLTKLEQRGIIIRLNNSCYRIKE